MKWSEKSYTKSENMILRKHNRKCFGQKISIFDFPWKYEKGIAGNILEQIWVSLEFSFRGYFFQNTLCSLLYVMLWKSRNNIFWLCVWFFGSHHKYGRDWLCNLVTQLLSCYQVCEVKWQKLDCWISADAPLDRYEYCFWYSWLDKLTSYSTSVVQWFHCTLWAPLVVYWRKYTRSYGKNKYFDLNTHILRKIWRFTKKWKGAFLLGIKFPLIWVQMENMIFYHFPLAYW